MSQAHHSYVSGQYGPRAADYVESTVHATGADLDQVEAIARRHPRAQVLDLGCGGGHVTYRASPHVYSVIACDITQEMVEMVRTTAQERGLVNVTVEQGGAEALPFEDETFDLVLCRFSSHHWHDLGAGLREARRVLRPSGCALFIDSVAAERALLDTHLQAIELLRDPSHVRNYSVPEWAAALAHAGFAITGTTRRILRMEFPVWTKRTRTDAVHVAALESLQRGAAPEVRRHFAIGGDGSFDLTSVAFELVPL